MRDQYVHMYVWLICISQIKHYRFGKNARGVFDIELFVGACYIMNDTPLMHVTYLERETIMPLIKEGKLSMEDLKEEILRRQTVDSTDHSKPKSSQKYISVNLDVSNIQYSTVYITY